MVIYADAEKFNSLYDECMQYIIEDNDANERIEYYNELKAIKNGDWERFVNSGVFHDAIGKVYSVNGRKIYVRTEY